MFFFTTSKQITFPVLFSIISSLHTLQSVSQHNSEETLKRITNLTHAIPSEHRLSTSKLIVPSVLIGYGIFAQYNPTLNKWNNQIRKNVLENINRAYTIDDYLQYTPAITVYALNMAGIPGKHNIRDRTILLGTSYLFTGILVNSMKYSFKVWRPDNSARNSFPSGHTAIAFAGAHFLYKEYQDTHPWIGIIGYTVAGTVGILRVINNRHWASDTITGAGLGILSTELAYLTLSPIKNYLSLEDKTSLRVTVYPGIDYNKIQYNLKLNVSLQ